MARLDETTSGELAGGTDSPRRAANTIYDFAYALIELRDTYHLSQQNFAKRIGISPQFQCDMESGRRMPSVNIIEKIVMAFGPKIGTGFLLRWHRLGARSHGWRV